MPPLPLGHSSEASRPYDCLYCNALCDCIRYNEHARLKCVWSACAMEAPHRPQHILLARPLRSSQSHTSFHGTILCVTPSQESSVRMVKSFSHPLSACAFSSVHLRLRKYCTRVYMKQQCDTQDEGSSEKCVTLRSSSVI